MNKLLSFDLRADFGMLKKPDTNEPVYLTFNMLHKPALLGILGAIAGMKGFMKNGELPKYYEKLNHVKLSFMPLNDDTEKKYHENGNFSKTIIKYNNSTGMASEETGGNLMVSEQTLIAPAFRCFVLLDTEIEEQKILYDNILSYKSEYVPYLGKNEHSLWWENARELAYSDFKPEGDFIINSLFVKEEAVKDGKARPRFIPGKRKDLNNLPFMYFENLPHLYLGAPLFQYDYKAFAYTNHELREDYSPTESFQLLSTEKYVIQLF
ncbi:CRISPR-associated protein Cas5 [Alkaliflexus imshenetskii]|uniref:CRISPR-associated protein Cas5 n=1 Tax=Alkaliflexus imshenetskii TaxID=286730 RepID=UPI00047BDAE6|nr:CRISPR-associated protein Cas5 [Alkaliflexus imshenetskii]